MTPDRPTWLRLVGALRWPATLIVALAVVVVALERACNRAHEQGRATVAQVGEAAASVAERFRTGTITTTFVLRAGNRDHLELVRETCRRKVAEFVRTWLLAEEHWRRDRFSSVTVVFADEEVGKGEAEPPTLRLERTRE